VASTKLVSCSAYFFDLDNGGDMFLRNVCWHSTDYTALYPRRWHSSNKCHPVTLTVEPDSHVLLAVVLTWALVSSGLSIYPAQMLQMAWFVLAKLLLFVGQTTQFGCHGYGKTTRIPHAIVIYLRCLLQTNSMVTNSLVRVLRNWIMGSIRDILGEIQTLMVCYRSISRAVQKQKYSIKHRNLGRN
jgi:hypothetical protein